MFCWVKVESGVQSWKVCSHDLPLALLTPVNLRNSKSHMKAFPPGRNKCWAIDAAFVHNGDIIEDILSFCRTQKTASKKDCAENFMINHVDLGILNVKASSEYYLKGVRHCC